MIAILFSNLIVLCVCFIVVIVIARGAGFNVMLFSLPVSCMLYCCEIKYSNLNVHKPDLLRNIDCN